MPRVEEQVKRLQFWTVMFWAVASTAALTVMTFNQYFGGKASAAQVSDHEVRITRFEAHHEDDDKRMDWLVKVVWQGRAEAPPPARKEAWKP